jgi:hypothetical protein
MPNIATIPLLTPTKWVQLLPVDVPQYISKFLDDWNFSDTILNYEQPACYKNLWLKVDAVRDQVKTNYGPITIKLMRCDGSEVYSAPWTTKQQDADNPGTYIRQTDIDLAPFAVGDYYWQTNIGSGPFVLVSEPFKIVNEAPNTVLLEYSHFEKFGGIYFQSPFSPTLRIPAVLKYNDTQSRDTIYEDDPADETLLRSVPYRIWDLKVGHSGGIPPWLADKIKRIFCCSDVRIDGRYFTKVEGAKWERFEQTLYPMQGWRIQLREKFNHNELTFENDAAVKGIAAAAIFVGGKGFGIFDTDDDYTEIESLG